VVSRAGCCVRRTRWPVRRADHRGSTRSESAGCGTRSSRRARGDGAAIYLIPMLHLVEEMLLARDQSWTAAGRSPEGTFGSSVARDLATSRLSPSRFFLRVTGHDTSAGQKLTRGGHLAASPSIIVRQREEPPERAPARCASHVSGRRDRRAQPTLFQLLRAVHAQTRGSAGRPPAGPTPR